MYTRSRQSQNFTGGTPQRNQGGNAGAQQYPVQPAYKQQGNYQGGNQNQQDAIKQGNSTPYKQQPQQQQTPQQQRAPNTPQVPQQQRVPNTPQTPQQPQQPQQPQTPQQPQQQRVQNTPQIKQQQAPTPQPQRLKPILKSSANVQAPASAQVQLNQNQIQNQNQQNVQPPQPNNGMEIPEPVESIDGDSQELPKWRRKTPGLKVSRKLKRLRMNQRLRKTLQPKNAIMVLNEMKTGVQFTFPESQSILPNSLFLVHAEIDGKTYVGQGISKPLARQNAAENALKSLLLEKMTAAASKARLDAETEAAANATDGENKEGVESMETTEESDDIPWSSLASFALYKLFLEWQNQGTVVPVPRPGVSPGKVKKESSKPVVQKELPVNAITIHPVMLLNQMRPGLTYSEVSRVGNPPNITFTLACEIDGQEYSGCAKNKKDAKKLAAKNALLALYDLTYPEEKEGEDVIMG